MRQRVEQHARVQGQHVGHRALLTHGVREHVPSLRVDGESALEALSHLLVHEQVLRAEAERHDEEVEEGKATVVADASVAVVSGQKRVNFRCHEEKLQVHEHGVFARQCGLGNRLLSTQRGGNHFHRSRKCESSRSFPTRFPFRWIRKRFLSSCHSVRCLRELPRPSRAPDSSSATSGQAIESAASSTMRTRTACWPTATSAAWRECAQMPGRGTAETAARPLATRIRTRCLAWRASCATRSPSPSPSRSPAPSSPHAPSRASARRLRCSRPEKPPPGEASGKLARRRS